MASRASIVGLLHGGNWMMHHLRRLSRRTSEQTVTYRNGSQVFIISDQVRPTTCSDTAVGIPEAEPPECTECRVTKSDCICLVVVICLIALVSLLVRHLWGCADSNIHSQDWHVASLCDNGKTLLFTMLCSFVLVFFFVSFPCSVWLVGSTQLKGES